MEGTVEWYREKAEKVADTLQEYHKDTDGWEVAKKSVSFFFLIYSFVND